MTLQASAAPRISRTVRFFGFAFAALCITQVVGAQSASAASVVPYVNCVFNNTNGTTHVVFGYRNPNPTTVNVPLGLNNQGSPVNPPTALAPGTNPSAFVATVPAADFAYWLLASDGTNYYFAYANNASTPKCPANPVPVSGSNPVTGVAGAGSLMGVGVMVRRRFSRNRVRGTFAAPSPVA